MAIALDPQQQQVEFFNHSETALLLLALSMMGLTTCLVANDLHWARSSLMQAGLSCHCLHHGYKRSSNMQSSFSRLVVL